VIKGKRGVSAELALKLAQLLGTTPEFWLNLQMDWELWHDKKRLKLVDQWALLSLDVHRTDRAKA
jgi:plasmid maintenance system antidote protein VapI